MFHIKNRINNLRVEEQQPYDNQQQNITCIWTTTIFQQLKNYETCENWIWKLNNLKPLIMEDVKELINNIKKWNTRIVLRVR